MVIENTMKNQDMYLLNTVTNFMLMYRIYRKVVGVLQNMNVIIVEKYLNVHIQIIIVIKKKMVKNIVQNVPENYMVQKNLDKQCYQNLYLLKNGVSTMIKKIYLIDGTMKKIIRRLTRCVIKVILIFGLSVRVIKIIIVN